MEKLVKYDSDDEMANSSREEAAEAKHKSMAELESEWASFEKMISADGESTEPKQDESSSDLTVATTSEEAVDTKAVGVAAPVHNPYAYLSQYTSAGAPTSSSANTEAEHHDDMEKHLEAFLEQAMAAAAAQNGDKTHEAAADDVASHSDSEGHSDDDDGASDSPSQSGSEHSDKSPRGSAGEERGRSKDKSSEPSTADAAKTGSSSPAKAAADKSEDVNSRDRRRSDRRSSPGSPSRRGRSRRSRSRSRRSRSRSRGHRHRRRRSTSRSRHGGSGSRRRRSGSRHRRHRRHRSRSPSHRHRSSRHRSSRHKRRSLSRERKRREYRKAQFLAAQARQPAQPPQEDFKARMRRELQQAAREAAAGKGSTVTPQQALLQTMAAMHAKAQELTGVELPKFYNPAAVNPLKFAEQQQKRKLLWSKAGQNKEQSLQKFQGTGVVADEKYRKLMGIKGDVQASEMSEEQMNKQNELFAKLDQEYAFARLTTHTHRGMGLGVVSSFAAASANEQFNKP